MESMGPVAQLAQHGHAVEQGMEGLLAVDAVVVQLRQRTFVPGQISGHDGAGEFIEDLGQVPAFPVFRVILPDILVEGAVLVFQLR